MPPLPRRPSQRMCCRTCAVHHCPRATPFSTAISRRRPQPTARTPLPVGRTHPTDTRDRARPRTPSRSRTLTLTRSHAHAHTPTRPHAEHPHPLQSPAHVAMPTQHKSTPRARPLVAHDGVVSSRALCTRTSQTSAGRPLRMSRARTRRRLSMPRQPSRAPR